MSGCPVTAIRNLLRPGLPDLTRRLAKLKIDDRGYPIPFFVAYIDGKPDFRIADPNKWRDCIRHNLCWVCGEPMGRHKSFVIGPMCTVNRIAADPPTHPDCAEWSVKGCPFLSKPKMERREDDLTKSMEDNVAGDMIKRNPGAMAIWTTRKFTLVPDGRGLYLLQVGEPESITWWREGRRATRAEVLESVESGLPILRATCQGDERCLAALQEAVDKAMKLLPE